MTRMLQTAHAELRRPSVDCAGSDSSELVMEGPGVVRGLFLEPERPEKGHNNDHPTSRTKVGGHIAAGGLV
jgi:hypothetical protein